MSFKEKILIVSDFDGTFYSKKLCQDYISNAKEQEYKLIARLNSNLGNTPEEVKNNILSKSRDLGISSSQAILSAITYEEWKIIRLATTWYDELKFDAEKILTSLPANCSFAIASHTPQSLIKVAFKKNDIFPIYGPEELKACKPDVKFFKHLSLQEGFLPSQCIYIGDKLEIDIFPALRAGYRWALHTDGKAMELFNQIHSLINSSKNFQIFKINMSDKCLKNINAAISKNHF